MGRDKPKLGADPKSGQPRLGAQPDSYKTKRPVWRFSAFDWDGKWGLSACASKQWRKHIEGHLASFETMTWAEIERAAGGKGDGKGNNSHPLSREKFSKAARERLVNLNVLSDSFFSLRLENTVRIYGIREDNCLLVLWFDPYHFKGNQNAAYGWQ